MGRRKQQLPPDLLAIAKRLEMARAWRGLGSRELGEDASLSEATVSSIENERVAGVEVATLFKLADALKVRRAWLICGDGLPELPATAADTK